MERKCVIVWSLYFSGSLSMKKSWPDKKFLESLFEKNPGRPGILRKVHDG